ncbi:MAG: hypothetical protein FGM58_09165 [Acidimicrobiia bacterium]|nr:hypothetical protein [Acidimicrobiia bacterium]
MSAPTPPTVTTIWQLDDVDWTPVQRQRNADGTVSVVREKWPIIRPGFLSAHVHYEPQMVVRRHGHRSNHIVFVLDGGGWIGGEWCTPGTHLHVPLGASFGPIVAGPEGLTCWEVSFGEFGGWGDHPELYESEINARGVTPLPDPPLDIGDWFVDPRGDWGGERPSPKVEGLESVRVHVEDLDRIGDGPVLEKRPIDEPGFTSVWVRIDPGDSVHRPPTAGHRLLKIVAGDAVLAGRPCPTGAHIEIPIGVDPGPITAGDHGVVLLELTDGPVPAD